MAPASVLLLEMKHTLRLQESGAMSAVILMGGSVLALSQTRANPFSASDLLVLSNFIMSSESFLQSTESFTPVCLPAFNPAAFLHAYVAFLHKVRTATTSSMFLNPDP